MTEIANAAAKQKGEEEGGEDESEEGWSSEYVNHSMVLQCVEPIRLHGSERVRIQWH
jgi:hypothetical protein